MKRTALALLSLVAALPLWATAQAPDVLKVDGKTYQLQSNPLEPYLGAHPGRMPAAEVRSTGLWRGYIATFALRDGDLYVDDVMMPTKEYAKLDGPEDVRFRSVMAALFGDAAPRVATWFTGHLIVPTGELVRYVHMGYASTYSSYLVVTVVEGNVRDRRDMNQAQFETFRRAQFAAFQKTPEYAKHVAGLKKGDESDKNIDDFLFVYAGAEFLSRIFTH